jgi:polyisoprenoid-binding protein YceI
MNSLLKICALSLVAFSRSAQAETLQIDPVHSSIEFKVKHLFTFVLGRFTDVSGTVIVDADHPENASVEATISTKSISTANDKRDSDLRSADFFDQVKFPAITFKSKKVEKKTEDTADVTGDLTMHGVTKEVVLHVKFLGKGSNMGGGITTGWEATTSLKRSEFGLTWNKVIEGTQVVGDDVDVTLQIAANSAK